MINGKLRKIFVMYMTKHRSNYFYRQSSYEFVRKGSQIDIRWGMIRKSIVESTNRKYHTTIFST